MSVAVDLDAARECSYCSRGGSNAHPLVDDGDGGWMHADPADCLDEPSARVAGASVSVDTLAAAPRERSPALVAQAEARTDAAIALDATHAPLDPADLTARERTRAAHALRGALATLASRVRYAVETLPRRPTRADMARVRALGAELRTGLDTLDAWEARCKAVRRGSVGSGRSR